MLTNKIIMYSLGLQLGRRTGRRILSTFQVSARYPLHGLSEQYYGGPSYKWREAAIPGTHLRRKVA